MSVCDMVSMGMERGVLVNVARASVRRASRDSTAVLCGECWAGAAAAAAAAGCGLAGSADLLASAQRALAAMIS
eukprot:6010318-Prymnesium_polylepis.1